MRRALDLVVRNWPLKLAAVIVATFLYAGLVLSQNAQVWPGSVPIVPKLPTTAVLIGNLPTVTNIRYFAPADVAQRLTSASFRATVDLSQANPQPGNPFVTVPVVVTADPGSRSSTTTRRSSPSSSTRSCPRRSRSRSTTATSRAASRSVTRSCRATRPIVSGPESVVRQVDRRPGERRHPAVGDRRRPDGRPRRRRRPGRGPRPGGHRAEHGPGEDLRRQRAPVQDPARQPDRDRDPGRRLPGRLDHRSRRRSSSSTATPMRSPPSPRSTRDPVSISGASTDLSRTVPLDLPDGVDATSGGTVTVTITFQAGRGDADVHGRDRPVRCTRRPDVRALDRVGPRHGRRDGRGARRARPALPRGDRRRRRARAGDAQGQAQGRAPGRRQARRHEPARGRR